MKEKILIVDDDVNICALIKEALDKEKKYEIFVENDSDDALETADKRHPDIVLLDVNLPGISGCDVLKLLKKDPKTADISVILISGDYTTKYDIVSSLGLGADDYITKPFQMEILVAKVKAHLRRRLWNEIDFKSKSNILKSSNGSIKINLSTRTITTYGAGSLKNKNPDLTKKEYEILLYFMKNKNRVISREILMDNLWNTPNEVEMKTVDKHIETLRNKLGSAGKKIESIFGVGYKFNDD
ncbi:MAG: response regulator transcription factor [Elusimicrobiota bacterium]